MPVKNLIKQCTEYISKKNNFIGFQYGPYSPVLFIGLGDAFLENEYMNSINDTIRQGWNNISEQNLVLSYPDEIKSIDELLDDIDFHIVQLKSTRNIFRIYHDVKLVFFLDSKDEKIDSYIQLFEEKELAWELDAQIILAIMVAEKTRKERMESRKKVEKLCSLRKKKRIDSLIVLSDKLYNGRFLSEEEKADNYRIVANLIYLANSYDIPKSMKIDASTTMSKVLFQSETGCTASYIGLSKPSKAIAQSTLIGILDLQTKIIKAMDFDASSHAFRKRMNRFSLEESFELELQKRCIRPDQMRYFPEFPGKDNLRKGNITDFLEFHQIMEEGTEGIWSRFVKENFVQVAERYFELKKEEIRESIQNEILKTYSDYELLEFKKESEEEILRDLSELQPLMTGILRNDAKLEQNLWILATNKAKQEFYQRTGKLAQEVLKEIWEKAEAFQKIKDETRQRLNIGFIPSQVTDYYENRVGHLFEYDRYKKQLDTVCESVEEYCDNLRKVFENYTTAHEDIYMCSFEDEIALRTDGGAHAIMDSLAFQNAGFMQDECRFNFGGIPNGDSYCMVFSQAKFIRNLKDEAKDEWIVETSRQEIVERMQVYNFDCNKFLGGEE